MLYEKQNSYSDNKGQNELSFFKTWYIKILKTSRMILGTIQGHHTTHVWPGQNGWVGRSKNITTSENQISSQNLLILLTLCFKGYRYGGCHNYGTEHWCPSTGLKGYERRLSPCNSVAVHARSWVSWRKSDMAEITKQRRKETRNIQDNQNTPAPT